jgi:tetratricopeptide (TPR) repeat protein
LDVINDDNARRRQLAGDTEIEDNTCDPIELLATDFTERQRRGEQPSIEDYADRHPHLANRIRKLFPLISAVEQVKVHGQHSSDGRITMAGKRLTRLGDFRIIREIGRGGMGIVYEAEQESLQRAVAIKILPPQSLLVSRSLERFQREARTAARLHHTNIVPVFGTGEADGVHYLVMQLIAGRGLDQWIHLPGNSVTNFGDGNDHLQQKSQLSAIEIARLGQQIVDAVAYAHREQVLHRDIKPANILVDLSGHVWVADFGLAHFLNDDVTVTQTLGGSLRYMPPERFQGIGDERSDIYGIGVTLYELAVGQPAFQAESPTQLVAQISRGEVPGLRAVRGDIPRDLETIIMKAMSPEPRLRYDSAVELLDDLGRFLDGRTILARRSRIHERCWRWARRNPLLASTCTVAAIALCATFVALSVGYSTAAHANRRAAVSLTNETAARHSAERTFALALSALNNVVEELAHGAISFEPSSDPTDTEEDPVFSAVVNAPTPQIARVLEQLIPLYDKLAKEAPDRDDIARQAANAAAKLGRIHFQLGNPQDSAASLHRAILLLTKVDDNDRDVNWARAIATIGNDLGAVRAAQHSFRDVLRAHRDVLNVIDRYTVRNTDASLNFEFGRAHYSIGKYGQRRVSGDGLRRRDLRSARPFRRRMLLPSEEIGHHLAVAVTTFQELLSHEQFADRAALYLARALRARAQLTTLNRAEREFNYQQAMESLEALVRDNPHEPAYQYELGQALAQIEFSGRSPLGRWRGNESRLRRASRIFEKLSDRYPTVPIYAVSTAQTHYRISGVMLATNRTVLAREHLRDALDVTRVLTRRFPDHVDYTTLHFRFYRSLLKSYRDDGDTVGVATVMKEVQADLAELDLDVANRPVVREIVQALMGYEDLRHDGAAVDRLP